MTFSSFPFVGLFLPAAVLGYFAGQRLFGRVAARLWLLVASIVFYGLADLRFLPIVAASLALNFTMARAITGAVEPIARRRRVTLGITLNVLLLGFFKYRGFVFTSVAALLGHHEPPPALAFPLGISFFTIQQIIFLMDCYEELTTPFGLLEHAVFLSFFPYITAGPISRAADVRPMLGADAPAKVDFDHLARGLFLFAIGLFKKAVIADNLGRLADSGFNADSVLGTAQAWLSSLSFTFQIYFDFSGYSDMATAAALMLNVALPQNFNSPLKSASIIEFWQRWHITLSNFITTYLYTPMLRAGGGKATFAKAMVVTLVAMTIAGLWHGPSWTFVVFGLLHGVGLVVNQIRKKRKQRKLPRPFAWAVTFLFVNLTFVFFRSDSLGHALRLLRSMFAHAPANPSAGIATFPMLEKLELGVIALVGVVLCLFCENSDELARRFSPSARTVAFFVAVMVIALLFMNGVTSKEFLYRDF